MDLNLARKPLAVKIWSDEDFGQLEWPPALDLYQCVLLNDVGELFLLLLPLVHLLLQLRDLLSDCIESMAVQGSVSQRANKRSVGIFKWLERNGLAIDKAKGKDLTVSSFFPAS